ncbi:MAG: cation-translocating P-type ATPase [Lachnospiraceae bacterium]|nr:cation-translocating P-type ATPase [Lachnospiraceae bacterium]
MNEAYQTTKEELLYGVDLKMGLSTPKAVEILERDGENLLQETKRKSTLSVFVEQFADLLVIILIAAAIISMISGNVESTIVIFAVITLNAILGTVQYVKAEKSLEALKALSSPHVKVLRDGVKQEIPSKDVVKGDLVLLEAGDMIVADGRIINNYSLQVNESSLTGESLNVDKKDMEINEDMPLGDRVNMVYSGSLVTYGRATVLVTATGMDTEMGKIAQLMNLTSQKKTPLQKSLDDFGKKLAIIIMVISAVVLCIRLWQGEPVLDSLMFAVALAVAAIPEALSSIVTIVQAMGTRKMARENAIIKELKAVESLGSVSVICSDKTGTLTQNKMTVQELYIDGECIKPEELDLRKSIHRYFLYNAMLNNDSSLREGKGIGDPTEYCLLTMAREACFNDKGINEEYFRGAMERLEEIPFDSDRKLMSTKYLVHGVPTVFTKGALDVLLDRTVNILTSQGVRSITSDDKEKILNKNQQFSEGGLRVLAFAYKELSLEETLAETGENNYTFIGLASMVDPPRPESMAAVADAKSAGIRPVMITGDHKVTATAIARQIGIFNDGDMALTGQELDKLTDGELDNVLERVSVYARVSPENKIRIVDAWQRKGRIVAMTGDGVNDAPALKKADIGVAMGITGTEVSKDASAMILSDDNFATIMKAVLNGRNVYRNILNAIQFLLSGNLAAIFVVLFCSFMALPTPFEPVHLLFINLLTDSLPALAIGMEATDRSLLNNKPRNPKVGFLTKDFVYTLLIYALPIATVTTVAFYMGYKESAMMASTMAFATLTLARLFHGFNCRSHKSIFEIGLTSNGWSLWAFWAGIFFLALVLGVPFLSKLFMVADLGVGQLGAIAGLAFIPTLFIQLVRRALEKFLFKLHSMP